MCYILNMSISGRLSMLKRISVSDVEDVVGSNNGLSVVNLLLFSVMVIFTLLSQMYVVLMVERSGFVLILLLFK